MQAALRLKDGSGSDASKSVSKEEAAPARAVAARGHGDSTVSHLMTAGFEALDLLNIGLVVCGAAGQLLVANATAQEILRSRDGLELNPEGVLSATHDDNGSLGQVISKVAKAARTGEAGSLDGAFAVRRPSGKRALTLFVRAVSGAAETPGANEAAVLVMILDAALPVEATGAELRQLYGFTATEAQLANLLMEGMALEDCCGALGIRRTTVRMHLRNIFAKTGVRRQGELVSLLLKSIGLGPRVK
ncbi:MAG: helix-turn-helix transcriptional regulator [Terriglobales bacterium]